MVGIITSQTLGEQSTQLTLNTFHLSGIGSAAKVITQGMPRLNEIMRLSGNMKNKAMDIYLKKEYIKDIDNILSEFKFTQLKDIISKTEILFQDEEDILDDEDIEYIKLYKEFSDMFDLDDNDKCESNWILRITFDKYGLLNNNISISTIQEIIRQKGNSDDIQCLFNDDNASEVILRVNIKTEIDDNSLTYIQEIEKNLSNMTIKGIKEIKSVGINKSTHMLNFNLDGSVTEKKDKVIYSNGSNLQEVLENDYVDSTKTITNNILEIYDIFELKQHVII